MSDAISDTKSSSASNIVTSGTNTFIKQTSEVTLDQTTAIIKSHMAKIDSYWMSYKGIVVEEMSSKMIDDKEESEVSLVKAVVMSHFPGILIAKSGYIWLMSAVKVFAFRLIVQSFLTLLATTTPVKDTYELKPRFIHIALTSIEQNIIKFTGKRMIISLPEFPDFPYSMIALERTKYSNTELDSWFDHIAKIVFPSVEKNISLGDDSNKKELIENMSKILNSVILCILQHACMHACRLSSNEITHDHFMHAIEHEMNWYKSPYIDILVTHARTVFGPNQLTVTNFVIHPFFAVPLNSASMTHGITSSVSVPHSVKILTHVPYQKTSDKKQRYIHTAQNQAESSKTRKPKRKTETIVVINHEDAVANAIAEEFDRKNKKSKKSFSSKEISLKEREDNVIKQLCFLKEF